MSNREHSRLKIVSIVIIITLIGKVTGLGRDMLMGHTFGTGLEADALATAIQIPRHFFDAIFASAISASFIPVFNEVLTREGRAEADRLASSFFTVVGLVAATLTFLGMVFAPQLVNLMATHFDQERAALAAHLLRIIFPSLFFTGMAFSMVGMLNSFGEFNIPAAMSVASNGILIVYFLFFVPYFGVYGAAAALLIGWAAQAAMQIPSLRKKGYRYRPRWRPHPGLKKIFRLMLPVMVSTWIHPINMFVSIRFASALPGGVASLTLANGLYIMIAGIFVLSVTNVIFPEMSRLSASGDRATFCNMVRSTIQTLLFLLLPMTVGLMILATPVVQLLYEYRQFDAHSTALMAAALFFLSLGMVGFGVQNVLLRAFYAEKNGKIPLLAGLVGILVNLILARLLVGPMGVAGLALAAACSLLTATAVLIPPAHGMLGRNLITGSLAKALGKMLCAALIMGALVFFLRDLLTVALGQGIFARLVLVGAPALLGIAVYLILAYLLRMEEFRYISNLIRKRRKEAS